MECFDDPDPIYCYYKTNDTTTLSKVRSIIEWYNPILQPYNVCPRSWNKKSLWLKNLHIVSVTLPWRKQT